MLNPAEAIHQQKAESMPIAAIRKGLREKSEPDSDGMLATRTEFVAKAGKEEHVRRVLREILRESFQHERGFLQGMVLVSDQEARLVTLLTFWSEQSLEDGRERRMAWLREKVTPLVDRCANRQIYSAQICGGQDRQAAKLSVECRIAS